MSPFVVQGLSTSQKGKKLNPHAEFWRATQWFKRRLSWVEGTRFFERLLALKNCHLFQWTLLLFGEFLFLLSYFRLHMTFSLLSNWRSYDKEAFIMLAIMYIHYLAISLDDSFIHRRFKAIFFTIFLAYYTTWVKTSNPVKCF